MADRKRISVTVRGITVKVPRDITDDIEFLDLMEQIEDGNAGRFSKLMRYVYGDKQYLRIKDKLKKDGTTRITDIAEFLSETMNAVNALEAKN